MNREGHAAGPSAGVLGSARGNKAPIESPRRGINTPLDIAAGKRTAAAAAARRGKEPVMPTLGHSSPGAEARVVLQPLRKQLEKNAATPSPRIPEKTARASLGRNNPPGDEEKLAREDKRQVPDIKAQASDIEKKVTAFCLDSARKINKEHAAVILRYFKEMRGIVDELLLHNSYLTGRLEQSAGEEKNKETAILNAVSKATRRLETAVLRTTQQEQRKPTYAEKVKITSNKVEQTSVKPPKNVVIIRPEREGGEMQSSEEALDAVFTLVNLRKRGIQVTAVRKIKGNGLVVETTKPESLKEFTDNSKLKEAGPKVKTPQRRPSRMIIYNVPRDIPKKEILACMRKQNQERLNEDDVAAIKFCFRTGRKDQEETNWVIEVPPQVREKLLRGKIFLSWNACKVKDYIAISRCYKCQGYGHVAKYCRVNYEICAHCAESGHSTKECKDKDGHATCVNCRKAGKKGDHAASSAKCPMYTKALEAIIARTNYE